MTAYKCLLPYLWKYLANNMVYYAVAKGRKPGIYSTWDECQAQVNGFPGCRFKKFPSKSEAEDFVKQHASCLTTTSSNAKLGTSSLSKKASPFVMGRSNILGQLTTLSKTPKRTLLTEPHVEGCLVRDAKKRKVASTTDEASNGSRTGETQYPNYSVDDDGYINVFTDGACSSNGYKNARAGIGVWFGTDHPLNVSRPVTGRPTNNTAEIQAVTAAAMQARKAGITKLKINTDSKFLIQCITKWMPKWKANGWMTQVNKPVINKTDLIEMEKAVAPLTIAWNHVNGHIGIHGNEMADKLAKAGCALYNRKGGKPSSDKTDIESSS